MKTLKSSVIISFFILFLSFLNLISISGCSAKKALIRESKNLETLQDTSFIEKSLEEKAKYFKNLKGVVRIKLKIGKKENSFNAVIALKNPDLLRIEILNPFGQVITFITSDGQNIHQTDLKNSRIILTPVSISSSEKFLGIPLMPQELLKIITGTISFNKSNQRTIQLDKDNNLYVLTEGPDSDNLTRKYWIDSKNFNLLRIKVSDSNGNIVYEVNYSEYQNIDNCPLPEKIICGFFLKNISIEINFKDISLNTEMPFDLFSNQNPSGFKIIYQE
ncbi:MAG: hypothetical protein A3C43_11235 [Candidatus Schekmanbacteria bacterium RIFCSPHIGHO2_02_FULL_38_11]|uniref:DUF4292 domain-containing protein n=1 Tax=Candidatus Schekmanbacteria bacterium RIFCSPLOWO2_12_FULL_38_15 TaxID=1817883 RepID=A0A1F7SJS7_9BACT|nr:MAG: hypothetical protein A2043_04815 [Candidatus Schekmanbacteria bacterium GWA2_38_9]OGL51697.1 MAG: hypothetical protein A3H37_11655 [Candidatus Schekmanbacteria bacterium RIFCSPLOWO2_02_FULL_38_14]OGL52366.1 MAG: hypothetical protein A3C43_11235 [Candidatus Schekmanbacteria bacterium RIFCSPHIGHO2_02_FULL_38_11]OGL54020.1 MAG: hypothetical protein A3G31_04130 [Candidatus Schekmanbacteria bacterium RIFCSPLOWO2_12_FULL_38_15]